MTTTNDKSTVPDWVDLDKVVPQAIRDELAAAARELADLEPDVTRVVYRAWRAERAYYDAVNLDDSAVVLIEVREGVRELFRQLAGVNALHDAMAWLDILAGALESTEWGLPVPEEVQP